jgi:predicted SAM-dependent methyltransferase
MRAARWLVEGQETDATAAQSGHAVHGVNIHLGALSDLALADNSFDAISLSHVIEHVHEPDSLLAECHRLLKPAGTLVAVTPNVRSYGHHRFGVHWVGLDPPKHLMLFSPTSLARVAVRAGFLRYRIWSTAVHAQFTAIASYDIQHKGRHRLEDPHVLAQLIRAPLFEWSAWFAHALRQDAVDECVLQAVK